MFNPIEYLMEYLTDHATIIMVFTVVAAAYLLCRFLEIVFDRSVWCPIQYHFKFLVPVVLSVNIRFNAWLVCMDIKKRSVENV